MSYKLSGVVYMDLLEAATALAEWCEFVADDETGDIVRALIEEVKSLRLPRSL